MFKSCKNECEQSNRYGVYMKKIIITLMVFALIVILGVFGLGDIKITEEKTSFIPTPINYQTNQIDLGGGKFAQTSYLGFENYRDGDEFKPINMTLIDYGSYWRTIKSVYYSTIPKYADEWGEFNNVFEGNNHSIKVKPVAEHIEGIVNDNVILYPGAFGEGIDLEVTAYNGHLLRKIIIKEPQNKKLYFEFEITKSGIVSLFIVNP